MGTISSGVGLISGLPIQTLVDQLIAVRARPLNLVKARLTQTNATRTAILDLSARLLSLKNAATALKSTDSFRAATASSSNESTLTGVATAEATPGSFTFTVRQLAATQQVLSSGLATSGATYLRAGSLVLESNLARLNRSTDLAALNGGAGVRTGRIRVTDGAGHTADIDLTTARTVDGVLDTINRQSAVAVAARVDGDRIVLEDRSGGSAATFAVSDIGTGSTALDLGIRGTGVAGVLTGSDVVRVTESTTTAALNDGNGIRIHGVSDDLRVNLADGSTLDVSLASRLQTSTTLAALNGGTGVPAGTIRITNRLGVATDVDLSAAQTVGQVVDAINGANAGVTATLVGSRIQIADNTSGSETLQIGDATGSGTTAALGLDGTADGKTLAGRDVYRVSTLGDVLRAFNLDSENGGRVRAELSASGDGIRLVDLTTGGSALSVEALNDSRAAADLHLTGAASGAALESGRLLAGLNTVLLANVNGTTGVSGGVIQLTNRAGASATLDLSAAQSLDDVLQVINGAGLGLKARVSDSGLGLVVEDSSGGTGHLVIQDVSGQLAAGLGLVSDTAASSVVARNLNRRYISENTTLAGFRSSIPFSRGKFRITDSSGASGVVDLTQGNELTIGDVISEINSRGLGVVASINASGDGLLLTDTAGGTSKLHVTEEGGTTARSLGILGEAAAGTTTLNGALERTVTVTGSDTLDTLAGKIRSSGAAVSAVVLNDGSSGAAFRLSLSATQSGAAGSVAIDAGDIGITFSTLVAGRDAAVILGPTDAPEPLVLVSSSNTLSGALPGVTLTLKSVSAEPVTLDVARDPSATTEALKRFVSAFNDVVDRIDELTKYNAETNARAVLFGDATTSRVRSRLFALLTERVAGADARFNRLASIGIQVGGGGRLTLDESKLTTALETNPAAIEALFATETTGLGPVFEKQLDQLSNSSDGVLTRADQSLQKAVELLTQRQTDLQANLDRQRDRLTAQFQASERVLAQLQSQQVALSALSGSSGASLAASRLAGS
ncbi:MAG: flagellar filament capping protein FliD [Phycisphaerae bacterium]